MKSSPISESNTFIATMGYGLNQFGSFHVFPLIGFLVMEEKC